ncbi:Hypothetical predicted protein, partial [Marmota monax]
RQKSCAKGSLHRSCAGGRALGWALQSGKGVLSPPHLVLLTGTTGEEATFQLLATLMENQPLSS